MLFVIVFTEKVNAGSMETSRIVGGKVSSLDCALALGDQRIQVDPFEAAMCNSRGCLSNLIHAYRTQLSLQIQNVTWNFYRIIQEKEKLLEHVIHNIYGNVISNSQSLHFFFRAHPFL